MAKSAHYEPWNGQDHVYWVMVKLPNWPIMNLGMGTTWPIFATNAGSVAILLAFDTSEQAIMAHRTESTSYCPLHLGT